MTRVLLDEGVPRSLARRLRDHGVNASAFPNDWKQLTNGALLTEIERAGFQVLITGDKQMQFQQNLNGRSIAVMVLPTNRRPDVMDLVAELVVAVTSARPGTFISLGVPSPRPRS